MANIDISRNRLIYSALLSLCAHVVLIAAVGFSFSLIAAAPPAPTLEVLLARQQSAAAPSRADFVAAVQQQGRDRQAGLASDAMPGTAESFSDITQPPDNNLRLASLREAIEQQRQEYASLPRRQVVTAAATRESPDADYLLQWRQRVEQIGSLYYASQDAARGVDGSLRMLVAVRADGSVESVSILQSSGHRILDETARRIVALASPFDPFPAALSDQVDTLEIIRTWQFRASSGGAASVGLGL